MAPAGTFSGLALWLSPSTSTYSSLSTLIKSLSKTYNTPSFEPHITLLTGFSSSQNYDTQELLETLEKAVEEWKSSVSKEEGGEGGRGLNLAFEGLGSKASESNYFQYLFSKVSPSPSLLSLRKAVRTAFLPSLATPDDYFPHLSLMYGLDDPKTMRIAEEIIKRLDKGEFENEGWTKELGNEGVESNEVLLVYCEGIPEEWNVLGKVSLV